MTVRLNINLDYCNLCNRPVHNITKALTCVYCKCLTHYSCTRLSDTDCLAVQCHTSDFTCARCVEDIFPFGKIDDDLEYFSTLFIYSHGLKASGQSITNVGLGQLNLMSKSLKFDKDLDPSRNCLNQYRASNYHTEDSFNSLSCQLKPGNNFSIVHINARSLVKNYDEICNLIRRLHHKFSVIAITETWTDKNSEELMDIDGYNKIMKHRENKKGGGVALFIDSKFKFEPAIKLNQLGTDDFESIFVNVFLSPRNTVTVGTVYRPPGGSISQFNDSLDTVLSAVKCSRNKIFLAGDFNINLLNHDSHCETDTFLNLMYSNKCFPVITCPTRFSSNGSTLIDNIFTSCLEDNYQSGVLINDISDHLPVFYLMSCNVVYDKSRTGTFTQRVVDDTGISVFIDKLSMVKWNVNDSDANITYSSFFSKFKMLFDECFPLITKKAKRFRTNSKPWFTNGLNKSVQKKSKLYHNWLQSRSDSDLIKYKKFKNKLTSLLRLAEKGYYEGKFQEIQCDISKTWKVIKSILPKSAKRDSICEIKINDDVITDPLTICNKFNQYFTCVGSNLAKKIPHTEGSHRDFVSSIVKSTSSSIFLYPTTPHEIIELVSTFKANKSPGYDDVLPKIVKSVIHTIAEPLSTAINVSFDRGTFPDALKIAKVVPIFKSDDRTIVSNYRPVSVLSVFSKIYEKVMYKRLFGYFVENKFLVDNQFGFREQRSTSMAILRLVDQIATEIDKGNLTLGVFIDLSKAFDTIDHNILLDKLSMYGIRGNCFDWFKSYLTERKQYVCLNDVKSDMLCVNCGVPQGSILGPLLFIIYVNDIVNISNILQMILFADDTNIFVSGPNINELCLSMNTELSKLSQWFKLNKLSLNIKKTNFIVFKPRTKSLTDVPNVLIDGYSVSKVESSRFLGVVINSSLDWNNHINLINSKVSKTIGILKYVKNKLPDHILRSLYFTLVNPYYEYCNIVWAVKNTVLLQKLFISQKRLFGLLLIPIVVLIPILYSGDCPY